MAPQESRNWLIVKDLETKEERRFVEIRDPQSFNGAPDWSPDGKRIVALVQSAPPKQSATLAVYDDHAAVLITRDGRTVRSNAPDCARDDLIEAMLQGGNRVVERTHHDSHPQHTPELGHGAIHVLTYAGMHSGSSPLVVLHGDDIAAPILDHAAKLRAAMLAG